MSKEKIINLIEGLRKMLDRSQLLVDQKKYREAAEELNRIKNKLNAF